MTHSSAVASVEEQITDYVSSLSAKNKAAVLTIVKTIAEAEFERKWVNAVPLEEALQHTLNTVRKLFDEKGRNRK